MPKMKDEELGDLIVDILMTHKVLFLTASDIRDILEKDYDIKYSRWNMEFFSKKVRRAAKINDLLDKTFVSNVYVFHLAILHDFLDWVQKNEDNSNNR